MLLAHNYACLTGKITHSSFLMLDGLLAHRLTLEYSFSAQHETQFHLIDIEIVNPSVIEPNQLYPVGSYIQVEGYLTCKIELDGSRKQSIVKLIASSIGSSTENAQINRVILIGKTGTDAQTQRFESGLRVLRVGLAVQHAGKIKERPYWFFLEMCGKTVDNFKTRPNNKHKISVIGSLRSNHWTNKQTNSARSKTIVQVESVRFLDGPGKPTNDAESNNARILA